MRNPSSTTLRGRGAQNIGVSDSSVEARFGKRVTPHKSGCWAFDNKLDAYGRFAYSTAKGMPPYPVLAHRFAYETLVGPIPEGHHLHHQCENRGCVNPEHLVPLTPAEHVQEHARLRSAS